MFSSGVVKTLNPPATTRITKATLKKTACLMANLTTAFMEVSVLFPYLIGYRFSTASGCRLQFDLRGNF
jgi:hypothetical protein